MLNEEEKRFIAWWGENRGRKRRVLRQLAIGLPLGLLFAGAIFINLASGWYIRAASVMNSHPSMLLMIIIAVVLIVLFVVIFNVKHRFDMNEQRYQELGGPKNQEGKHEPNL